MNKNFGPLPPLKPALLAESEPHTPRCPYCGNFHGSSGQQAQWCLRNSSNAVQERRTGGGLGATATQTCPRQSLLALLTPEFLKKQTKESLRMAAYTLELEIFRREGRTAEGGWKANPAEAAVAQGFDGFGATAEEGKGASGATAEAASPTPPGVLFLTPAHFEGNPAHLTPEAAQTFCQDSAGILTLPNNPLLHSFQKAQE